MELQLQMLPIGTLNFEKLRLGNKLYVDKTGRLMNLIKGSDYVFLSRPRPLESS